jgi:hypothetical protein
MLVTLLGMVTDVRPLQPWKAEIPMVVTLLGMVIDVRPEQFMKADLPMLVTLLGIVVLLQPRIRVFVDVSIRALQLSLELYCGFSLSTVIEVRPLQ